VTGRERSGSRDEIDEPVGALERYLEQRMGDRSAVQVTAMPGGGSCEVFAVDRGPARWVLRRAPRHASSATAHDVLREFRILDAIKDEAVAIARPVLACDDPEVFGTPFYLMERVDGVPIRAGVPSAWAAAPETHGRALEELIDALVAIHAVDWRACGLGDMAHRRPYLESQVPRWLSQLRSYGGRDLPPAHRVSDWLEANRPEDQPPALFHGDYKLDNVLFAPLPPPQLLAVVDWEMAAIGDPLVDLAWALIFHPGPGGTVRLGTSRQPTFAEERLPTRDTLIARYAAASGRDTTAMGWYDVFARWKLAIVLEGSYAKFVRGLSDKPAHQHFGHQADLLLESALRLTGERAGT
jgi:aminoglycoside phosphotransferase (APT) family kinase protein